MADPAPNPASDPANETRSAYPHLLEIQTRWADNDLYGHVNNVVYYSYFDTVVNRFLIDEGGLDIHQGTVIGVAVETMCVFRRSVAYPERLDAGLRVARLGNSSVRYEIGIFGEGDDKVAAHGHFVHVFVDRASNKPHPIPDGIRTALARIAVEGVAA